MPDTCVGSVCGVCFAGVVPRQVYPGELENIVCLADFRSSSSIP